LTLVGGGGGAAAVGAWAVVRRRWWLSCTCASPHDATYWTNHMPMPSMAEAVGLQRAGAAHGYFLTVVFW